jgi:hypothetical protein
MELPDEPTANDLAEFVRSNDGGHNALSFKRSWYEGMESWTDPEIYAAADAAQCNKSIRSIAIDVAELEGNVAAVIARIISQLRHVRKICVWDSDRTDPNLPMARPHVVDALLYGIMESQSSIEQLQLYGCCSTHTFRDFKERFPGLEILDIDGKRTRFSVNSDSDFDDFTVALAVDMGNLSSLREFYLNSDVGSVSFLSLLSAVETSSTVNSLSLTFSNRSRCLLPNVFLFFARRCPDTVQTVHIRTITDQELLDISSFFPVGGGHASFSPTIVDVQFTRCEAKNADPLWLDRAATALAHVDTLSFFQCQLSPFALEQLLVKLSRLGSFSCLSRKNAIQRTETLDDEFDDTPYVLGTNEALIKFCQVIERPSSLLKEVELDVVSPDESMDFPAIASLFKHSNGQLIVNFGQLPPLSSVHVVKGAKCLNIHLQELRIRFCRCEFGDGNFATFIRALGAKQSLKILEFGFDTHAGLGTPESSIAAIEELIQLNSLEELAVRGLGSEAVFTLFERIMPAMTTENRSLRKLEFFGADLTDVWSRIRGPLLAALKMNGVLCHFSGDVVVPDDDKKVRHLLKQNQYGRQLLLSRDALVPMGLWATTFARIAKPKHHDVMYPFLRAKLVSLLHPSRDDALEGQPPRDVDSGSHSVG